MIDLFHLDLFRRFGPGKGSVLCLGDQRPTRETGYRSSSDLFAALGYSKVVDVDVNGRATETADLNHPCEIGVFDLVYDGGTLEHVANIGQALTTIVQSTAAFGVIVQCNPINCYGASYYGAGAGKHIFVDRLGDVKFIQPFGMHRNLPETTHVTYVGKRVANTGGIIWPKQKEYSP